MVNDKKKQIISKDDRTLLQKQFNELKETVTLYVFTKKGQTNQYTALTKQFTEELMEISPKIQSVFFDDSSKEAQTYHVEHFPTILMQPDRFNIRYIGAPFGEESQSFLGALMLMSNKQSGLSSSSKKQLSKLSGKRDVKVFVTLSCPYCPGQVLNGFKAAIQRPDLISASCIDAAEFHSISLKYHVGAVPHTVINDETISKGFEPEERFIKELVDLKPMEEKPQSHQHHDDVVDVDLLIIGGGPAGLTAGLYAARSGLETVIIEKESIGGQVSITPIVENWPGFSSIPGKKLMDMISSQVREYVPIVQGEQIQEIKIGKNIEALSAAKRYVGKALILATGATHRTLNVAGEKEFYGRGVSYCATCDGYLFRENDIVVVGGGNTALTDALYLHNLGANVTIIHRRDQFRAEQYLIDSIQKENIPVIWNAEVTAIIGKEMVTHVEISDNKKHKNKKMQTSAVFIAIGEQPNNDLAGQLGISLDEGGYVVIDRFGRTNIPRLYAAGDVTGGVRQIVTAVSEGATAATSAFHDFFHTSK